MEQFVDQGQQAQQAPDPNNPMTAEMQAQPDMPMQVGQDPNQMFAPGFTEEATPEDHETAVEDLVTRSVLAMTDNQTQQGMNDSPADSFLKTINTRGMSAPEAVGKSVGTLFIAITQNAKRQGVEYPGMALLEAGSLVTEMALALAKQAGIFPDLPIPSEMMSLEDEGEYTDELLDSDFVEEEGGNMDDPYVKLVFQTMAEAAKHLGEYLLSTGQVDPAEYKEFLVQRMEEEAASGELEDFDIEGMIGPEKMNEMIRQGVV